ncbi:GntR family transcriptional regulator [Oceanivirga salmonicida]|uniref:GntR family transcriptional regulator n=1 Tax=Oceanivirga salmonicida TaxID=1769291 RepID=UPI000835BB70|nr:GntR family transcriptional regulator [Oceanivirga salmonicida]
MAVSLYYEIYEKLRKNIIGKKYSIGKPIPSERDLMKIFNVSRTTIRQAIQKLENDNLIYKVQGKGNIVSRNPINQNLNNFYSFHNMILSLGKTPTSKVIFCEIINAGIRFSEIFGILETAKLYHIKRLRLIDGEPAMLENTFIPESRFKNFNCDKLNTTPMYEIFKKEYDIVFNKAKETFKPVIGVDTEDIKYLHIDKNDIVMQIIRTAYERDKVVEYTISHVRNDLFEYTVNLSML